MIYLYLCCPFSDVMYISFGVSNEFSVSNTPIYCKNAIMRHCAFENMRRQDGGGGGWGEGVKNPSHAALSSISLEKTKFKHQKQSLNSQIIVVINTYFSSCQK